MLGLVPAGSTEPADACQNSMLAEARCQGLFLVKRNKTIILSAFP